MNQSGLGEREKLQTCANIAVVILRYFSNFFLSFTKYVLCHLCPSARMISSSIRFVSKTQAHKFAFNIFTTTDCIKSLRYYLHLCVWVCVREWSDSPRSLIIGFAFVLVWFIFLSFSLCLLTSALLFYVVWSTAIKKRRPTGKPDGKAWWKIILVHTQRFHVYGYTESVRVCVCVKEICSLFLLTYQRGNRAWKLSTNWI